MSYYDIFALIVYHFCALDWEISRVETAGKIRPLEAPRLPQPAKIGNGSPLGGIILARAMKAPAPGKRGLQRVAGQGQVASNYEYWRNSKK